MCGTIAPEDRNLREMLNVTRTWEAIIVILMPGFGTDWVWPAHEPHGIIYVK